MFRLFVSNVHCKHIIFGGCHDNGYLPNLEPYKRDESVASRMTLLETTPAARNYSSLAFRQYSGAKSFRKRGLCQRIRHQKADHLNHTRPRKLGQPCHIKRLYSLHKLFLSQTYSPHNPLLQEIYSLHNLLLKGTCFRHQLAHLNLRHNLHLLKQQCLVPPLLQSSLPPTPQSANSIQTLNK